MSEQKHWDGCPVLVGANPCTCIEPKTEMTSLVEMKRRLAAIEQDVNLIKGIQWEVMSGQGVICERLDSLIAERAATMKDMYTRLKVAEIWYARAGKQLEDIHVVLCQPKKRKKKAA